MGSVCSCFQGDDFGEYANVGASIYRHCICLRCFARQIIQAVCPFVLYLSSSVFNPVYLSYNGS